MAPSWPAVVTQLVGQSTYSAEVEHSNSFAAGQKLASSTYSMSMDTPPHPSAATFNLP